jgi:NADH-quinone oxidoreductase subunit L
MTHAFFKACLFLGAGSVIHAMSGEQDMLKMGALGKAMKRTAPTFVIAALTIAGLPPLAAFFSKDEILWSVFNANVGPSWLPGLLWFLLLSGAGVTAFYMFRAVYLTFFGARRYSDEAAHHLHESPPVMTVPLIILAAGSVLAGFVGVPAVLGGSNWFHHYLQPAIGPLAHAGDPGSHGEAAAHGAEHGSAALEFALMALSVAVAAAGIFLARHLYLKNTKLPGRIADKAKGLYRLVYNKYFVDEAYEATIVRPGYRLSESLLFRIVDVSVIDGIVNGVGVAARLVGSTVRLFQTGVVRTYALIFLLGLIYLIYRLAG